MDKFEENAFKKISSIARLLQVNWNALDKNPPCKNYISSGLTALNAYITLIMDRDKEHKEKRRIAKERKYVKSGKK